MNLWADAIDALNEEVDNHWDEMTLDQRLKVAEIKAMLSISQELSKIHHEGINPNYG
jgi:hypothetical protein